MTVLVSNSVPGLKGVARVPGDKSISHRSLMLGAVAHGETVVTGILQGEDVLRTARALISMGVIITPSEGGPWRIRGLGKATLHSPRTTLDLGNSGTSARLLMGLIGGYPVSAVFAGDTSLSRRPMGRVIKPLAQMGVRFETSGGDRLPLRVTGSPTLRPIAYTLPVASAQVKSAILFAALHAQGTTTVTEPAPTRDHTERMLRYFGAEIETEESADGSTSIHLKGFQSLHAQHIHVPADPSSAAFPAVAALLTPDSDIAIPNMLINPRRTGLYDTLLEMGADITFENKREKSGEPVADLHIRSSRLRGTVVPSGRVPSMIDEFPVLAMAAACAEGKTVMTNLAELRVKESDRLAVIATGLERAGVRIEMGEDSLTVHGTGRPPAGGCRIETHLDHRIAMSFLVLGMVTQKEISIDDATPIATSFPDFVKMMNGLGADIGAR